MGCASGSVSVFAIVRALRFLDCESELKAEGAVAVCAVLNDEKDRRTDKYEQEWNGLWRFYNVMQFSDEFIAVSSVGMSHMDYLALPVAINADSDIVAPVAAVDDAWNGAY